MRFFSNVTAEVLAKLRQAAGQRRAAKKSIQNHDYRKRRVELDLAGAGIARAKKHGAEIGDRAAIEKFYLEVKTKNAIPCYYCGVTTIPSAREVDHKQPLSRGGTHRLENLAVCCPACNGRKYNRTEEEFRCLKNQT